MSPIGLLILGIILLVISYYVPQVPPPVHTVLLVLGWIFTLVGALLLILALLGISTGLALR